MMDFLQIMESARTYTAKARPVMHQPHQVADYCRPLFAGLDREALIVMHLTTKRHLIGIDMITIGLVDRSLMHAREVFRGAILANCANIVMSHNHPSGDPTPSTMDIEATRAISAAGKIIGITLVDHVIVGHAVDGVTSPDFLSMRDLHML
jgi:DNA repair protein RadC